MNCSDLLLIAALLHEAWYHGASLHTTLNLLNEWGERRLSLRRWAAMMSWRSRPHACLTMILRCLLVVCAITMSTTPHETHMLVLPSDCVGRFSPANAVVQLYTPLLPNSRGGEVQCECVEGTLTSALWPCTFTQIPHCLTCKELMMLCGDGLPNSGITSGAMCACGFGGFQCKSWPGSCRETAFR